MANIEQLKAEIASADAEIARLTPAYTQAKEAATAAQAAVDAFYARPGKMSVTELAKARKAVETNPSDTAAQQALQAAQSRWDIQQSEFQPLLKARDDAFDAQVEANKPIVAANERAAQADLAIASIDPSQASPDAVASLSDSQKENAQANASDPEFVQSNRRVTSVDITNGQTTRYYSDGSSETDNEDGTTTLDDGSGIPVIKPEEEPTNNNAGQPDYSNNGGQVPGVQVFDDGSTLQTFDDGSTLATGTDGSVTSSPSDDVPTGKVSSNLVSRGMGGGGGAKAEWKEAKDLRAILRVPKSYLTSNTDPSSVLRQFGGIIFPYTPSISFDHSATYSPLNILHSNYTQFFYKNSAISAINLTAKFTVQKEEDGVVLLGVIHLLRSLTKMRFGPDKDSGAPPPVCRLEAYGDYMLRNVPVAVASFRHELPDGVDYIAVGKKSTTFGNNIVPVLSTISLTLNPMYSRSEMQAAGVNDWLNGKQRGQGYL